MSKGHFINTVFLIHGYIGVYVFKRVFNNFLFLLGPYKRPSV